MGQATEPSSLATAAASVVRMQMEAWVSSSVHPFAHSGVGNAKPVPPLPTASLWEGGVLQKSSL